MSAGNEHKDYHIRVVPYLLHLFYQGFTMHCKHHFCFNLLRISYPTSSHYREFVLVVCEYNDWAVFWMRTYIPQRHISIMLFNTLDLWIPYWFKKRLHNDP